jgi:hypothetical protein
MWNFGSIVIHNHFIGNGFQEPYNILRLSPF